MKIDQILTMASAIVKNKKGEILLLQRSDFGSFEDYWQLPEGKTEQLESPGEAIVRELSEEIGITINNFEMGPVFSSVTLAKGKKYLCIRQTFNVDLKDQNITLSAEHKNHGWFTKEKAFSLELLTGIKEVLEYVF